MKKMLFGLIATVMITSLSFGQNEDFVKDELFIKYLKNDYELFSKVKNRELLQEIINSNQQNWDRNTIENLSRVFGISYEEFVEHVKMQDEKLKALNNKYEISKFNKNELIEIITNNQENIGITPIQRLDAGFSCRTVKWACQAGVFAAATLGQIACGALDVETAGVSAYLGCHGAVILAYSAGLVICIDDYNHCITQ